MRSKKLYRLVTAAVICAALAFAAAPAQSANADGVPSCDRQSSWSKCPPSP